MVDDFPLVRKHKAVALNTRGFFFKVGNYDVTLPDRLHSDRHIIRAHIDCASTRINHAR